jgi:hypothetical protein
MLGSAAVIAWVVSTTEAFDAIWSYAVVGGVLYALVTMVRLARSHRQTPQPCAPRCSPDADRDHGQPPMQVSKAVNTTSRPVFAQVGASPRWPGLWIGAAVLEKPAQRTAAHPPQPANGLQRRRLSLRSVIGMSHQKGSR